MAAAWIERRAATMPARAVTATLVMFSVIFVLGLVLAFIKAPVFLVLCLAALPGLLMEGYTRRLQRANPQSVGDEDQT